MHPGDWQTFTAFAVPMTVYAGAISLFVFVVSSAFNIESKRLLSFATTISIFRFLCLTAAASVLFVHSAAVYEKACASLH